MCAGWIYHNTQVDFVILKAKLVTLLCCPVPISCLLQVYAELINTFSCKLLIVFVMLIYYVIVVIGLYAMVPAMRFEHIFYADSLFLRVRFDSF